MSNLLQKRTLDEKVNSYSSQYGLPREKAFLFLVIERLNSNLDLNSIDIEESIVDGSDDCGIDAIVIDEETETNPRVYFYQSKFHTSDNSFEKRFPGNEVEKLRSAVESSVLRGKINKKYQNERLVDRLHSILNLSKQNPRYTIVYCSNGQPPSASAITKLEEFVEDTNKNSGAEYLSVEFVDLERIIKELVAPEQTKKLDIELQTVGKNMTEDNLDVRLFVGAVEGSELSRLVDEEGDELFEKNVRGFLKKNNPINKGIIKSSSGDSSPYFLYMNNGITLTCEKFSAPPRESSLLELKNAQIVNGQQTARSIHQAKLEGSLKDDVKVLVRIVETENQDVLPQIIAATNSQTRVTSRDLHSNDEMQRMIERTLEAKGYFYEARKNKYQGKQSSKRVDAEVAAQAYFSCLFERPAYAKDKKKELFGRDYDEVFNDKTDPDMLLQSYLILQFVRKMNKLEKFKSKYTFLSDAALHITALIYRFGGTTLFVDDIDEVNKELASLYGKAVRSVNKMVSERVRLEGDKYEHRRTFKDPETYGRVVEIMQTKK